MPKNNNDWKEYYILLAAIDIAFNAHEGQVRKLGNTPYIFHPLAVMNQVDTLREKIVAILHDVIEDHPEFVIKVKNLLRHDQEMIEAIALLTKDKGISYDKYVDKIIQSGNKIAVNVKIADLRHNLSTIEVFGTHLKGKYEAKYRQSLLKLSRQEQT